ncbi:hypothetical protein CDL12_02956 [Handroanthus impetiginosus]|uniref:Uncharacterized protein n=1 Tax=Handroanthus impetiginosus TaxID=429701 RepID=A0A2G9I3Y6_9LAMI|nr:hypothetical protein CDL12_02956 [Handroanthus impetiginosus]
MPLVGPPRDDKRELSRGTKDPNNTIAGESSSLRKASKHLLRARTRKRVQAFSVDWEQMIKDLFEQFKDHKSCSYMIANALDNTGKISAARASHKLNHFMDEVFSDVSSEGADKSDDETLLSLRYSYSDEGNNKKVAQKLPEDNSD